MDSDKQIEKKALVIAGLASEYNSWSHLSTDAAADSATPVSVETARHFADTMDLKVGISGKVFIMKDGNPDYIETPEVLARMFEDYLADNEYRRPQNFEHSDFLEPIFRESSPVYDGSFRTSDIGDVVAGSNVPPPLPPYPVEVPGSEPEPQPETPYVAVAESESEYDSVMEPEPNFELELSVPEGAVLERDVISTLDSLLSIREIKTSGGLVRDRTVLLASLAEGLINTNYERNNFGDKTYLVVKEGDALQIVESEDFIGKAKTFLHEGGYFLRNDDENYFKDLESRNRELSSSVAELEQKLSSFFVRAEHDILATTNALRTKDGEIGTNRADLRETRTSLEEANKSLEEANKKIEKLTSPSRVEFPDSLSVEYVKEIAREADINWNLALGYFTEGGIIIHEGKLYHAIQGQSLDGSPTYSNFLRVHSDDVDTILSNVSRDLTQSDETKAIPAFKDSEVSGVVRASVGKNIRDTARREGHEDAVAELQPRIEKLESHIAEIGTQYAERIAGRDFGLEFYSDYTKILESRADKALNLEGQVNDLNIAIMGQDEVIGKQDKENSSLKRVITGLRVNRVLGYVATGVAATALLTTLAGEVVRDYVNDALHKEWAANAVPLIEQGKANKAHYEKARTLDAIQIEGLKAAVAEAGEAYDEKSTQLVDYHDANIVLTAERDGLVALTDDLASDMDGLLSVLDDKEAESEALDAELAKSQIEYGLLVAVNNGYRQLNFSLVTERDGLAVDLASNKEQIQSLQEELAISAGDADARAKLVGQIAGLEIALEGQKALYVVQGAQLEDAEDDSILSGHKLELARQQTAVWEEKHDELADLFDGAHEDNITYEADLANAEELLRKAAALDIKQEAQISHLAGMVGGQVVSIGQKDAALVAQRALLDSTIQGWTDKYTLLEGSRDALRTALDTAQKTIDDEREARRIAKEAERKATQEAIEKEQRACESVRARSRVQERALDTLRRARGKDPIPHL
jgi:hypothetical protein